MLHNISQTFFFFFFKQNLHHTSLNFFLQLLGKCKQVCRNNQGVATTGPFVPLVDFFPKIPAASSAPSQQKKARAAGRRPPRLRTLRFAASVECRPQWRALSGGRVSPPPPPCFHPGKPAPGVLISSHRCRPALWDSLANCLDRDKAMKATSSRRVDGAPVVRLELAVAHVRHVAPPLFWVSSPPSPDFGVCWFVLLHRRIFGDGLRRRVSIS